MKVVALIAALLAMMPIYTTGYADAWRDFAAPGVTVLFGGDMMFDRTVRTKMEQKGGAYIFSCIDELLRNQDMVVANLEGPITDFDSISATSSPGDAYNYTFTFDQSTAALLHEHNFSLVNLGNNHILNFGREGVVATKRYLQDADVGYFGDIPGDFLVQKRVVRGMSLTFIGYNEFGGDSSKTMEAIRAANTAGELPIVYAHWGDEYASTTPARIRTLAHSFIDEGAQLVVGSHSHVVGEHEVYAGKHIYYSLGNLVFDQYFEPAVMRGLMIEVRFTPYVGPVVREVPVDLLRDRRTCPDAAYAGEE